MNLSPQVDGESWMRILISVTTGFVAFNAQVRKQLDQEKALFQQQQQQFFQLHQQAQIGGLQAPTPPTRELFESDPIGYMEEKLKYDD